MILFLEYLWWFPRYGNQEVNSEHEIDLHVMHNTGCLLVDHELARELLTRCWVGPDDNNAGTGTVKPAAGNLNGLTFGEETVKLSNRASGFAVLE